jgi:RNA polymerase sigma-70 factor (ECF subfamily)
MEHTGEDLMAAVARGDEDAFAAIYDGHAPRLLGLIVSVVGDRTDAEDVLQEVFREIWLDAGRYRPELGPLEGWLARRARFRAIDLLRRRGTDATRRHDYQSLGAAIVARGADEGELAAQARRSLAALPVEQRDAVCLAYYRGLSCRQIAELHDLPVGTVKTRLRLGTRKLRELLADAGTAPGRSAAATPKIRSA